MYFPSESAKESLSFPTPIPTHGAIFSLDAQTGSNNDTDTGHVNDIHSSIYFSNASVHYMHVLGRIVSGSTYGEDA